jgi:putative ABC transport system permease protein
MHPESSSFRRALDTLAQDLRYALRLVRRHPGFSAVAIFTLALGIGANTAIFSVIHAVFFRPLPYPSPERLVQFHYEMRGEVQGSRHYGASYRFLRDHLRSYADVASFMNRGAMPLVEGTASEPIRVLAVAPQYFAALGAAPVRGRTFTAAEAAEYGADAIVLSDALWQRAFHADPAVLDRAVLLGGRPHVVVGIMPASFVSRPVQDAWIPLRPGGHEGGTNLGVVARLRDGVTMASAQGELDAAMPAWYGAMGHTFKSTNLMRLRLRPFQSDAGEWLSRPLTILMATVALVLLIACANLANLLLARATTRVREIAVRATLGASRARLVRQLIVESLVLAIAGGLAGVLLARWTTPALLAISPVDQRFWGEIGLDSRVLAFAAALSLGTGILFGLVPALQATRVDLSAGTKEGGRQSGGRRTGLLRQTLIVGQVAASVTLLIGALLLARTFLNLTAVDPGFDPRGLTVASMGMANDRYATAEAVGRFYREALEHIRRIPGVESAAVISNAPMDSGLNVPFISRAPNSDGQIKVTDSRYVTPDYFQVMRAPILAGRGLTDADTASSARIAVVNQEFARTFLRGLDPLGQRLQMSVPARTDDRDIVEIVGVVADMKQRSLAEAVPPTIYVPVTQMTDGGIRQVHVWFETHWVVRSVMRAGDGDGVGAVISPFADVLPRAVRAVDPLQPFSRVTTMTALIDRSLTSQRFHMLLMGACAMLAATLAAAGLFGVISYVVAQRSHEMGVRLALGATVGQLVGSVVRQGAALAAIGVAIGVAGAFGLTRLLATFMFGISPTDPPTFALAAALLLGVAIVATLLPALRLTRLDPATVLRRG